MARTVPPSFAENGPELRVLIPMIRHKPKKAKNRGKPRKKTLSSEMEFFWGGPNGKVVAPGILVICPVDQNRNYHTKKRLFAPNIQIGSKKHIFAPSGQLEPHRSMFSNKKRCVIGFLIIGYQKFYSPPPKNWIFSHKNSWIWLKTGVLGQISAFLAHLRPCWSNKCRQVV